MKAIAVAGPTAGGKTALALSLAHRLDGEIIACDSMQIYREMDIGTAKPTPEERASVPHLLFDFVDPMLPFSAADYALLAMQAVEEIIARGHLPVFCGGTGLYLDAVRTMRHRGRRRPLTLPCERNCSAGRRTRRDESHSGKDCGRLTPLPQRRHIRTMSVASCVP